MMEHRAGNIREAQTLFSRAIAADPAHVWSYQVSILCCRAYAGVCQSRRLQAAHMRAAAERGPNLEC